MTPTVSEHLWWVAFTDDVKPCFVNRFLRRGFRHCWAWTQIRPCVVLALQPALDHCQVQITDIWPYEVLCGVVDDDPSARVVAYDQFSVFPPVPQRATARGFPVTCASYLGYTLGLDGTINTPYGLYRHLLAGGGRIVAGVGST